jgi:NADPH-dependent curcumin reductase CurA
VQAEQVATPGREVIAQAARQGAALAELQGWVSSGQLKVPEDVLEGLAAAPAGLIGLLAGENRGKRMVRVA